MTWKCIFKIIIDLAPVASALISVLIYRRTVTREKKINTMRAFSKIRMKYPNMSPYAENSICDRRRREYLKEMEFFCTGVNSKIYDIQIVKKMSRSYLIDQYFKYLRKYVNNIRSTQPNAYSEYVKVINKLLLKGDLL